MIDGGHCRAPHCAQWTERCAALHSCTGLSLSACLPTAHTLIDVSLQVSGSILGSELVCQSLTHYFLFLHARTHTESFIYHQLLELVVTACGLNVDSADLWTTRIFE